MNNDTPKTKHEKRCAQIADQLTAIIMGDTGYVGPEKFKALTLRLAEQLLDDDSSEVRLLEAVADIAFLAGAQRYHSGDSREDVAQFIAWAREFEPRREVSDDGEETYDGEDYMTAIEEFSVSKFKEKGKWE